MKLCDTMEENVRPEVVVRLHADRSSRYINETISETITSW